MFERSDGQSGDSATDLAAGNYLVIVTDAKACSNSCSVPIEESELPSFEIIGVDTS